MLQADLKSLLQCPVCKKKDLYIETELDIFQCKNCNTIYPIDFQSGICSFLLPTVDDTQKKKIRKWWGDLSQQRYSDHANLNKAELIELLDETEDLFQKRNLLPFCEMPDDLNNLLVLEIGSGGGGHAAIFSRRGASVVALDITLERAISTAQKLDLISNDSRAYQGDAEALPFRDSSFDIVYSNGVLHHTENSKQAINEIYRVLKPSGKAVLMLYARHSAAFWLNIFPRGLLTGKIFKLPEPEWIGQLTEGTPKFGTTKNPFTRVYSQREIKALFSEFELESIRKNSFQFDNIAIPKGTQLRNFILKLCGIQSHLGARILYGTDFYPERPIELWLGKFIGFGWNIVVKKPITKN